MTDEPKLTGHTIYITDDPDKGWAWSIYRHDTRKSNHGHAPSLRRARRQIEKAIEALA